MKSTAFELGLVTALLVAVLAFSFEGPDWAHQAGVAESGLEPVLVFVIPDLEKARRVRDAIRPERLVWQGEQGLAVEGGHVIALDLDDAADVIEAADWVDRPIEIVRLEPVAESGRRGVRSVTVDESRLARIRALAAKPTLTRSEQVLVLQAMNDGLEL